MFTAKKWASAQNGDLKTRNEIFEHYIPLVHKIAQKLSTNLPPYVEMDDIRSPGYEGLLDAISKFEHDRGFKFETYAATRIRGTILDSFRQADWMPRTTRARDKSIGQAEQALAQDLGRAPSMEELSDFIDMDAKTIHRTRSASLKATILSIDAMISDDSSEEISIGDMVHSTDDGLYDIVDPEQIAGLILGLPRREAVTLALHYYLGMTLAEIGREFKVTESRVCQIHLGALRKIREGLESHLV
jgi:RNA polymerase sigma factor for flagellar operon FliA